jgi:hypothetical protein
MGLKNSTVQPGSSRSRRVGHSASPQLPHEYLRANAGECLAIAFKINGRFMNWWQVDIPDAELSNVEIWNWR